MLMDVNVLKVGELPDGLRKSGARGVGIRRRDTEKLSEVQANFRIVVIR